MSVNTLRMFAYHLPDHPVPIRRQNIHRGLTSGDVDDWIRRQHPGQRIIIRYVEEHRPTSDPWKPPAGYYDKNKHLWRELLPEGAPPPEP